MKKKEIQFNPHEFLKTVFARLLNVPTVTAANREKWRRKPSGAALRFLQIARNHPEALVEV